MTQIKNKKKSDHFCKKDYSVRHITSALTTARKIPKNKGKNPDKMCQLIFLKIYIPTITETMTYKSSMYPLVVWES